jgi:hypothetical protein
MTELITIEVAGVTVVGEIVSRWARDIEVRLVSPFSGLSASCSVPIFAAAHVSSYEGPTGDAIARELLAGLHTKAVVFHRHREGLTKLWRATEQKLRVLELEDGDRPAALREEKGILKQRFQEGGIDQRQYQRALRLLRDRCRAYDNRRRQIIDSFMSQPPWPDQSIDLAQVVTFLGALREGHPDHPSPETER